jgi:phosphoribosylanthranilate isomerase
MPLVGWQGGLNTENVADAIKMVRPFGVDVSSGVEVSPGVKDPEKVWQFCQRAKGKTP